MVVRWVRNTVRVRSRSLVWVFAAVAVCAGTACRTPQRNIATALPEPIRDPKWVDPTLLLAEVTATGLADDSTPQILPGPPTQTELPEDASTVAGRLHPHYIDALSLVIDVPAPATATAAGAGLTESWLFEHAIRGSAYGLTVTVSRHEATTIVQLASAATEIGAKAFVEQGEEQDLSWVVKLADGPVQQVWAARTRGRASLVAVCTAPPAYLTVALSACKTLRFDTGLRR